MAMRPMSFDLSSPFVLIDDARANATPARIYAAPRSILVADTHEGVLAALAELDRATAAGAHAAGFLCYEAGYALEPRLAPLARGDDRLPLLWFGLFDQVETIAPQGIAGRLPDPAGAFVGPARPLIGFNAYRQRFEQVHEAILAGDIYQANLTFPAEVAVAGDPLAIYAALRSRAGAGYGGVVWTGQDWLLSLSPELFFAAAGGRIAAQPMKGTAPRGESAEADRQHRDALAADPKQRAENLMIVDLMRNDLSRIAAPGSVRVPDRFRVETYPSVHQMTSTVVAELAPEQRPSDLIRALFPCGSITGAPKLRAMEIIAAVEDEPRGVYTGAIGTVAPSGAAQFNVAIRTLRLRPGEPRAMLGLGSGVVADSQADEEWRECLTKAAFLTRGSRPIDLIETIAFDPLEGMPLLERHLARMKASADALGFAFDRHTTRNELQAATFRLRTAARIRLMLGQRGTIAIEVAPVPTQPAEPVAVALRPLPVVRDDFRLRHKTSDRGFWQRALAEAGTFEVVFTDAAGHLTEGSFTSIFVAGPDGRLITPPLSRGLLPGVLRSDLIDRGKAVEGELTPGDLAQGFYVGNALRGLIAARLVAAGPDQG